MRVNENEELFLIEMDELFAKYNTKIKNMVEITIFHLIKQCDFEKEKFIEIFDQIVARRNKNES